MSMGEEDVLLLAPPGDVTVDAIALTTVRFPLHLRSPAHLKYEI